MNEKYQLINRNVDPNVVSKKLSMIIHHDEIFHLTKLIKEIIQSENPQEDTCEG